MIEQDEKSSPLGSDIRIANYPPLGADLYIGKNGDIEITSDEMNIAQSILHRLLTIKGELADLGHPDYGSTIFDLVGQPNNWTTRTRLRLAIRDTIRAEHRVKNVVSIDVNPSLQSLNTSQPSTQHTENRTSEFTSEFSEGMSDEEIEGGKAGEQLENNEDNEQKGTGRQAPIDPIELFNTVEVRIVVVPIGSAIPVQLAFPFNLEAVS